MENNISKEMIKNIIDKKIPVYFISPHLDDALLSAGGLISYLSDKTKVTVVTLFTHASKQSSLSAKVFLKQCGYKDALALFKDRREEDSVACESLGATAIHLGYKDALWREKRNQSALEKITGSIFPETTLVYPTYRFHVRMGVVSPEEEFLIEEIGTKLKEIISDKAVVFGPLGMGNHIDHVITKKILKEYFKPFYWFDQPYVQANVYQKHRTYPFTFAQSFSMEAKKKTVLQYKTQVKALFGAEHAPELDEYFVTTDILDTEFASHIGDYYFVKRVHKNQGHSDYLYALYSTKDGKHAFAKLWNGSKRDRRYILLKNEEKAYKLVSSMLAGIQKTKAFEKVSIPSFIGSFEGNDSLTILTEYKEGSNLVELPIHKKVDALEKAIVLLENMNENKVNQTKVVLQRKAGYLFLQLPIIMFIACLRHPKSLTRLLRSFLFCFSNMPFLIKHKKYGFVHRDVGEENILSTKNSLTLHDFQLACYGDIRIELATTYLKACVEGKLANGFFDQAIKKRISNSIDARVFYVYCLYFALYEASMFPDQQTENTMEFIDVVLAKVHNKNAEFADKKAYKEFSIRRTNWSTYLLRTIQGVIVTGLFAALIIFFTKGAPGKQGLLYQTTYGTQVGSPFESSNTTSRYALVQAIVDNHSLLLTREQAQFAAPDVAYFKGKFFSLFTPGISLLSVPFYIIGKWVHLPQLVTFFSTDIAAILNVFLIAYIVKKINNSFSAGIIGGLAFLFGTNALAYSQTLTQHHISVLILLLAISNCLSKRTWINNIIIGALYGVGLLVDIPNAFLMLPVLLYAFWQELHLMQQLDKVKLAIKLNIVGLLIGLIPLVAFFGWYNFATAGSYTKLAQFIGRTGIFNITQQNQQVQTPVVIEPKGTIPAIGISFVFKTRAQLNGMYTLLVSKERSWWYYCPVVFIGLLGYLELYRKRKNRMISVLLFSIVILNIVLYSMFGDPWGGWSFGPRYLIPAEAVLGVGIGLAVQEYRKKYLFIILFGILLFYSIWVNVLGALTTASIPPQVEAEHLTKFIPYTYAYNLQLMQNNTSSSLFYNLFVLGNNSVRWYFSSVVTIIFALFAAFFVIDVLKERKKYE